MKIRRTSGFSLAAARRAATTRELEQALSPSEASPSGALEIDTPELSIITVVWNNRDLLGNFLDSIFRQRDRTQTEVIFVDNGSTDGSQEFLRGRDDVVLLVNGVNAGYPVAMNLGVARARGRYLVLCNPDIVFREGALDAMRDELTVDPAVGGVSPAIEVPGPPPSLYPLLRTDPGLYYAWNYFSGLMFKFARSRLINWNLDFAHDRCTADLRWIHGCCGMYRREALAAVGGGFDSRFFMYFEDADLGRTLRRAGWRLRMARRARILHLEEQSSSRVPIQKCIYFMESWHKYLRKHASCTRRAAAHGIVAAALALQLAAQVSKWLRRRPTRVPALYALLKTHLFALFRNLEAERAAELRETGARLAAGAELVLGDRQ